MLQGKKVPYHKISYLWYRSNDAVMQETNQRVATLEKNIVLLLNKLKDNHYAIMSLRSQLEESKHQAQALIEENTALKSENDSLTVANSLLGSNESNATTKHKINTLIEQVDACINQLHEMVWVNC